MTNIFVLPGLGTVVGGCRSGYAQMMLAFGGLGLTIVFVVRLTSQWINWEGELGIELSDLWMCLVGIAVFLIGWLWSLASGLRMVRDSRS